MMSDADSCPLLHKLPPELRLRIYECFVLFESRLVPPATDSTHMQDDWFALADEQLDWDSDAKSGIEEAVTTPIDTVLFTLNQEINDEAIDVFYACNKFDVHYERLCTCSSMKTATTLNEFRLIHLKIQGVEFQDCPAQPMCGICFSNGFDLLRWLRSFSRLRFAGIAFTNVASFARCSGMLMDSPHRIQGPRQMCITASQIGRLHINGLQASRNEMRSPVIVRTWPAAASMAKIGFDEDDDDNDLWDYVQVE